MLQDLGSGIIKGTVSQSTPHLLTLRIHNHL